MLVYKHSLHICKNMEPLWQKVSAFVSITSHTLCIYVGLNNTSNRYTGCSSQTAAIENWIFGTKVPCLHPCQVWSYAEKENGGNEVFPSRWSERPERYPPQHLYWLAYVEPAITLQNILVLCNVMHNLEDANQISFTKSIHVQRGYFDGFKRIQGTTDIKLLRSATITKHQYLWLASAMRNLCAIQQCPQMRNSPLIVKVDIHG